MRRENAGKRFARHGHEVRDSMDATRAGITEKLRAMGYSGKELARMVRIAMFLIIILAGGIAAL